MKTIEEKAHEYAKEISLSYGVFGASTLICDAIKKVAERAYIKCYEDIMAIPLSERITEEEKEKIRKEWTDAHVPGWYAKPYLRGRFRVLQDIFGRDFFEKGGNK